MAMYLKEQKRKNTLKKQSIPMDLSLFMSGGRAVSNVHVHSVSKETHHGKCYFFGKECRSMMVVVHDPRSLGKPMNLWSISFETECK